MVMRTIHSRVCRGLATLLLATATLVHAAGRVEFAEGAVTVTARDGLTRLVKAGDRIFSGETVSTDRSAEAHLVMDDNAILALRPNTRLTLESYVADGDKDRDAATVSLLQGALRSVTGWVAKLNRERFLVKTRVGSIGVRGTDFEAVDVEQAPDGSEAGVYVRVTDGETALSIGASVLAIPAGKAAVAPFAPFQPPKLLPNIPAVFKPTANEKRIEEVKRIVEQAIDDRLRARQQDRKLPDCVGDKAPEEALKEFIRAYESGNLVLLRERLDPMMLGFQRLLDGITQEQNSSKQLRIFTKDVQVQCGPDLSVLHLTWEKRFLEVLTFEPRLVSGRGTILLHRGSGTWRLAAIGGDNPFAASIGALARLVFGPTFNISTLDSETTASPPGPAAKVLAPSEVALVIEVQDADLAGRSSVAVEVTSSRGERETLTLPAVRAGVFRRDRVSATTNPVIAGNGVLEVRTGDTLTARYVDPRPGDNRPPATITQTVTVTGMPTRVDTTPDPFTFAPVLDAALDRPVESAAVTVAGINRPAPISVIGGQYRIDGGPPSGMAGTVRVGQRVSVIVQSAPSAGVTREATVSIGGVAGTFRVTTAAAAVQPPISIAPVSDALVDSDIASAPLLLTGLTGSLPISIVGGTYAVNGGSPTTAPGTVRNGDQVVVRVRSSPRPGVTTSATLTIGIRSAVFSVTTAATPQPDPFSFAPVSGAMPGSEVDSAVVVLSGGFTAAPISISGGTYTVNGAAFTSASGMVRSGDQVRVRVRASSQANGTASATLSVGPRMATFTVTTAATVFVPITTPDPFSFTPVVGAMPGARVLSNAITVTGINTPTTISVIGGEYIVSGSAFVSTPGMVSNGATVQLQVTAPNAFAASTSATLTVGGVSATFTVSTLAADTTPDPFSFNAVSGAAPGSLVASNVVSITGINAPASLSIVGGEYSIAGGTFTSAPGSISNGQTLQLRTSAPTAAGASSTATVTVGGVSAVFNVSTAAIDTTPDPFSFAPVTGAALSTRVESAAVIISGINAAAPVSITGGEYSVGGGTFTSAPGAINNGQTLSVRTTSSAMFSSTSSTTVTVGGVSGTFSVTTLAIDTTPDPFSFTPVINAAFGALVASNVVNIGGINAPAPISITGGSYSINGGAFTSASGTISNGQSVAVQVLTASVPNTPATATLSIGGVSAVFTATTGAGSTTPNPFSFTNPAPLPAVSGTPPITTIDSNPVTITGITTASPVSIVGNAPGVTAPQALFSVGGGAFTTGPSTISNNQTVQVRVVGGIPNGGQQAATLTIGGVSATFTVTRTAADTTPDAFSFTPLTNVPASVTATLTSQSNLVTVSGINVAAPISIVGGLFQINGGAFGSTATTVNSGDTVRVQVNNPAGLGMSASATLTIGGVSATFTVSTAAIDTTPDPINFTPVTNAALGTPVISAPVTISGINSPAPVSIVGGMYSIAGGPFTAAPGTISNGATLTVLHISASTFNTNTNATVNVGGVVGVFSVTTLAADTTPDPFSFPNSLGCPPGPTIASATVTITGINTPAPVSIVSGGGMPAANAQYSINGGAFTSAPGSISNGQTLTLQVARYLTVNALMTRATVTVGGVSATWSLNC
jgi:hypothetical protein